MEWTAWAHVLHMPKPVIWRSCSRCYRECSASVHFCTCPTCDNVRACSCSKCYGRDSAHTATHNLKAVAGRPSCRVTSRHMSQAGHFSTREQRRKRVTVLPGIWQTACLSNGATVLPHKAELRHRSRTRLNTFLRAMAGYWSCLCCPPSRWTSYCMGWRTLWWGQQRSARTAGSLVFSKSHVGCLLHLEDDWLETSTDLVCGKFRNPTFLFIAKTPGECAIHSEQLFRLRCNSVRWHSSCLGCSRWWWWQFSSAGTWGEKKSLDFLPQNNFVLKLNQVDHVFPLGADLQYFSFHLCHCNECPHFHENGDEPNPIYPVASMIWIYVYRYIHISMR